MRSRLLKQRTHQRTIVTLLDGDTYDGLLQAFDGVVLQLVSASLIGTAGQAIQSAPVDGVLHLPWSQVSSLQYP
jgi:small nuclear ribonucleoprotein (snRNP)-like protein